MLQLPLTGRPLLNSSRGQPAPSRARRPNLDRKDSETTFPAWRAWAQTSRWFAHGKPSGTWSSATWPNLELFSALPAALTLLAVALPHVVLLYVFYAVQKKQLNTVDV